MTPSFEGSALEASTANPSRRGLRSDMAGGCRAGGAAAVQARWGAHISAVSARPHEGSRRKIVGAVAGRLQTRDSAEHHEYP